MSRFEDQRGPIPGPSGDRPWSGRTSHRSSRPGDEHDAAQQTSMSFSSDALLFLTAQPKDDSKVIAPMFDRCRCRPLSVVLRGRPETQLQREAGSLQLSPSGFSPPVGGQYGSRASTERALWSILPARCWRHIQGHRCEQCIHVVPELLPVLVVLRGHRRKPFGIAQRGHVSDLFPVTDLRAAAAKPRRPSLSSETPPGRHAPK